jgi:hypothetical protein
MKCSDTVDIHRITKVSGNFIAIIRYTFIQGSGAPRGVGGFNPLHPPEIPKF